MKILVRQYRWKWLVLLVPSLLILAVLPESQVPMPARIVLGIWVIALCICLPISGGFWERKLSSVLDWLLAWAVKRFGKERAFYLIVLEPVVVLILMTLIINLIAAIPFAELLFGLGIVAALLMPALFIFIKAARGGQHA